MQNVLNIGTGTGIWTIDFADQYPSAHVVGTDLSPVQPEYVPPNWRFYIENAEKDCNFETEFDYIHGRMLVIGFRNWERFFEQAFQHLKPSGYIELQDLNFPLRCGDDMAPLDSPLMIWSRNMMERALRWGVDLEVSNNFSTLLEAAGFVDIRSETHSWPINHWPKDKMMKERGMWRKHLLAARIE